MNQSQYATVAQLQTLSITQASALRFGTPAMTAALQAASSVADSYIASQFTLPLQVSPIGWDMSLVLAVCNIAAWLLFNQFGFAPQAPGDALVEVRYKAALEWLALVRDEEISPTWTDSSGAGPASLEAGPYAISDQVVGFTKRGVGQDQNDDSTWLAPLLWWP